MYLFLLNLHYREITMSTHIGKTVKRLMNHNFANFTQKFKNSFLNLCGDFFLFAHIKCSGSNTQ